ncbi:MAG: 30S ribosomal protein S11 [Patescibacteria group bacterium]|nr:30S ribosomal protein S11 [Patescibacteria group bacterium]
MGKKRVIKKTGGQGGQDTLATIVRKAAATKKKFTDARIYISSSYNNTLMTLTDEKGNAAFSMSAGRLGFRGTRKSTPFAAAKVADALTEAARTMGVKNIAIYVKGIGSGRDSALRSFAGKDFDIVKIEDVTPIPHNGPRAKKPRRV